MSESSSQEGVSSPNSNDTDSGNSDGEWGDPLMVCLSEFGYRLVVGMSDSDENVGQWGNL